MGKFEIIPASVFSNVDKSYQRELNMKKVDKMVREFDPSIFGVLIVSRRADEVVVVDGQHRLIAARNIGMTEVPCLVYEGLTVQEEAQMFHDYDAKRGTLTSLHRFWALVGAGDKAATSLKDIVEKHGYNISRYFGARRSMRYQITSIATLIAIARQHGLPAIDSALEFIAATWPGESAALHHQFIKAVVKFLDLAQEYPSFDYLRAVEQLRSFDPQNATARAKGDTSIGISKADEIVKMMVDKYNMRLSKNRLRIA